MDKKELRTKGTLETIVGVAAIAEGAYFLYDLRADSAQETYIELGYDPSLAAGAEEVGGTPYAVNFGLYTGLILLGAFVLASGTSYLRMSRKEH